MSLLAPFMLGLLALGILIALLHVRRRRPVTVPGLMIWKQIDMAPTGMRALWQWPRPSLLLLLQLLALVLIVLALSQPFWGANREIRHWIYVLDNSASMGASNGTATRRAEAEALVRAHAEGDGDLARYSLIIAGNSARPELARQAMLPDLLADALARVAPEDGAADWPGARALVETLHRPDEITQVIVVSDAPPADFLVRNDSLRLALVPVGAPAANAGVRAVLAPPSAGQEEWTLAGEVTFSDRMDQTVVTVEFQPQGGERQTLLSFKQAAAGAFTQSLAVPGAGIVSVQLAPDAAGFDDRVDFVVNAAPSERAVLYVGPGEQPLAQALAAIDGVTLTEAASLPADADRFDLVLIDGVAVEEAPATNLVWIGAAHQAGEMTKALPAAAVTGWRDDHPLSRAMGWQSLVFAAAYRQPAPTDAEIIAWAGDAPLVTLARRPEGYDLRLGFDPAASSWAGQPALAVLAVNLMELLGPLPGAVVEPHCEIGVTCPLDVRLAGGTMRRLDAGTGAATTLAGAFVPDRAGLYQLEREGRSALVAVPPLVGAESRLATGGAAIAMPDRPVALWPWLIGAALTVLLIEAVLAGRGEERFATRELLSRGATGRRRRLVLGTRLLTLALALGAWFNLPLWIYRADQAAVAIIGPEAAPVAGAETLVLAEQPRLSSGEMAPRGGGFSGSGTAALQLAAALLPPDRPGRIVLGADVGPEPGRAAGLLERGIPIDAVAGGESRQGDLAVSLRAPAPVFAGDRIELVGLVQAPAPVEAEIVVRDNGGEIWRDNVALTTGSNRVTVPVSVQAAGLTPYQMEVVAAGDPEPRNNVAGTVVSALPPGRIAVLAGQAGQGAAFAAMLADQGFDAELVPAAEAPETLDGWLDYAGIVLMNLPAIDLTIARQELIQTAVADHGRGLLILGGPNTFGPGGYLETPLDAISPISARVPRDKPGVAMVFVLDRSSSMKQPVGPLTRLDVAKQATLAAIELLSPESQVAVVTFDSGARLTVPMTAVTDKEFIARSVNQVSLGGGTALYRGLVTAYQQLRDVTASARHIVVMTDGESQPADYDTLMEAIGEADITVSSVAIGAGSERELIEMLAREGGGLFHATSDFAALPSILSQEAMLLAGEPLEERPAQPYWLDRDAQFLRGMDEDFPPIEGFVLATPKPEATTHAVVEDQFGEPVPLLASWQYGAGQVLAMTTDAAGDWTRTWQGSSDYPRLFTQALRSFLPATEPPGLRLSASRQGDVVHLRLTEAGNAAEPVLEAVAPDGGRNVVPLHRAGEGLFGGSFVAGGPGAYQFVAHAGKAEAQTALYLDYPARLDPLRRPDGAAALVAATGGRHYAAGAALELPPAGRWSLDPAGPLWLGLALLVFIADLVVRYSDLFTRLVRPRRAAAEEPI
ncbi:VWA domain-containing protein [Devosia sp. 919]|uniref:VWA domain-containing protein n=1 Tax=Devosia sp. 919 TaxID=2726065 RepID=UPI001551AF84|nr:VWA domain-containing protein [Devosia sp. 919]